jgi:tripartite-type tricarboxylate transporter receptor subunit TctC
MHRLGQAAPLAAAFALSAAFTIVAPHRAQAAEPFAGKTIEVLVGHAAGGGYDLYTRVMVRHMAKHVPGTPNMVVKNMPGAGGLRLAGFLANGAPKDGTSFGLFDRGGVIEPLLGNPGARFDASKLTAIGSIGKQVATCAAWYQAPVQTIQQALKQELLVGGTGPSATTTYPAMLNTVLHTKFKIVSGYKGSSQILLAMEQGEVQGVCLSWPTLKAAKPDWVRDKKLVPLVQISFTSHPDLKGVPLMGEFAKSDSDRKMLAFFFAPNEFGRPYFGPPALPADRLQILRRSFDATMKDKAFLAEAAKAQMEVEPITGEEMQKLIADIYDTPAALVDKVAAAMAPFREKQ